MTKVISADYLEDQYAFLDDCPQALLEQVICSTIGTLEQRSTTIQQWYKYLLQGEVPPQPKWLEKYIAEPVQLQVQQSGIAPYLKNQPDLAIEFLQCVISQWDSIQYEYNQKLQAWLEKNKADLQITDQVIDENRFESKFTFSRDSLIYQIWHERINAWKKLESVFGDLSDMLGRDVNITQGLLKHQHWRHIERLQELLSRIDEFKKIVDSLGRLQENIDNDEELESFFESISCVVEDVQEKIVHYIPDEMSGIERSGSINRMLPQEALFLGHPKLKILWHAKRYEQALLSYRVQGIEIDTTWINISERQEVQKTRPRFDRGPMLIVIDTSGSMSGTPELVAKALTLQAAKTAHVEKRPCFLYAFGGKGEQLEYELKFNQNGLQQLLEFLGCSFGGGTDIATVEFAIKKLETEQWNKADVMIVSDGEWSATSYIQNLVEKATYSGTRFHGVQVGGYGAGLKSLCQNIHNFKSWDM
ncbi:VWA domain-containing protein [Acinetobacter brisouii]|uniref:VWA domain-containing protein n=1 Tax=Acinetobacter brisouii TaxID=396323 RepID=UPI00124E01A8|nr:VWA domain-containing protein [Acinetobacter brisouii]